MTNFQTSLVKKYAYSVSHSHPTEEEFNTAYMVTDKGGLPYKIYKVFNNIKKKQIGLSILDGKSGIEDESYTIPYSPYAGLVLTPDRDSVTYLPKPYQDLYIISFDDETKHYVNLNFVTKDIEYSILFSIVSDSTFKRNKAMLQELALYKVTLQKQEEERKEEEEARKGQEEKQRMIDSLVRIGVEKALGDAKRDQLVEAQRRTDSLAIVKAREDKPISVIIGLDSLCRQFIADSIHVATILESINSEIRSHNNAGLDYDVDEERRYVGEKKNGEWEGNGLMIIGHNNIFKGTFAKNQFIKGVATLKLPDKSKYTGEYSYNKPKGFGQLSYPDNDIAIGYFDDDGFNQGIVHKTDKDANYYYGYMLKGKKNGFGIYVTATSNFYIGIFSDDKLINGYVATKDEAGLKNYFEVKDSIKMSIDGSIWKKFSDEYAMLKSRYHM